ncbi:TPA: DMT family transporter [Mannheimia haemolytica]
MVLAVQKISTATATIAVIFGQLLMSILINRFGWLGNTKIDFSYNRWGAVVCLGIALYFIYKSNRSQS